jgi:MerR family transcriptional regulator, light-induced transcriptional regulator
MSEGWVDPSELSCPVPDRATNLHDVPYVLPRPDGRPPQRSDVYEALISYALSEVFMRRMKEPRQAGHPAGRRGNSASPHPRLLEFVDALFDPDARSCWAIAKVVFAEQDDPQRMAETLFEPAARFIGEKWVADDADVLKARATLSRMRQTFFRMAADKRPAVPFDPARRILLAPAPGERHGSGLSMVEDAFQRAGWAVDRCQGNDDEQMFKLAETNAYLVIGLSIGAGCRLPDLRSIARRLRAASRERSVMLMAGGNFVTRNPQSAIDAGFDFAALDAPSGIRFAEDFISRGMEGGRPPIIAH